MGKVLISITAVAFICVFFNSCATSYPVGLAFTKTKLPVQAVEDSNRKTRKVGTATCKTYCSLIAVGDASIEKAKRSAGITKIHYIDWDVENILGIYGQYTVRVFGE